MKTTCSNRTSRFRFTSPYRHFVVKFCSRVVESYHFIIEKHIFSANKKKKKLRNLFLWKKYCYYRYDYSRSQTSVRRRHALVVAIRSFSDYIFNPFSSYRIQLSPSDVLFFRDDYLLDILYFPPANTHV